MAVTGLYSQLSQQSVTQRAEQVAVNDADGVLNQAA